MAEHLSNLTKFYVSSAVVTAAVDTVAEYAALTWVQIANVYDLGEFGDLANAVETTNLSESRVRRLKGLVDGGQMDVIVNRDSSDLGQAKLEDARKSIFDYGVKIVLPDKVTEDGVGTTYFFRGAVLGCRTSLGEADNVVRATWSIAVNSERLEVAAT